MKTKKVKILYWVLGLAAAGGVIYGGYFFNDEGMALEKFKEEIKLPAVETSGGLSLQEALIKRRSVREYQSGPLTLEEVAQLLWSAQGVTADWGARTAPSAGALYPLELYLAAGEVTGLKAGLYKYVPERHALILLKEQDIRPGLFSACLSQEAVRTAPISLVICAEYERTTRRYSQRGRQYVHIEAGHAGQNIYLQAESLGLGTVAIGAFVDERVKGILGVKEEPLYIFPVGRKK